MTVESPPDPETIARKALSHIGDIATLPEVTLRIIRVVEDPKSTARDLHEIIKTDPALSAKILKVVNSAFYGLPGQVANLDRAIVLLGLTAVKNISISASVTRLFNRTRGPARALARQLWSHSVAVAVASRLITRTIGRKLAAEEAFLAGLIHDLGIIVELQCWPDRMAKIVEYCTRRQADFCQTERQAIGADHQTFGRALATKWNFPRHLRTVMGYHHTTDRLVPDQRELATIVHLADILAASAQLGLSVTTDRQIDPAMLEAIGLNHTRLEPIIQQLPEQHAEAESLLHD